MYHLPYGGLCLVRVYALYGRSRRILGLLLGVAAASLVNAFVSHFSWLELGVLVSHPLLPTKGDRVHKPAHWR
jgi:hypothetical protein